MFLLFQAGVFSGSMLVFGGVISCFGITEEPFREFELHVVIGIVRLVWGIVRVSFRSLS